MNQWSQSYRGARTFLSAAPPVSWRGSESARGLSCRIAADRNVRAPLQSVRRGHVLTL